jgi:hypothetical protein
VTPRLTAALLAACAVGGPGCADGLQFRHDERVRISIPPERAEVRLPVRLRWHADVPRGTIFGVFVDRAPMAPGEGLERLAAEDELCRRALGCPDREWLERNRIHLTRRPSLTLPSLPHGGADGRSNRHELTIVLLDARGRRLGESAWTRTLFLHGQAEGS